MIILKKNRLILLILLGFLLTGCTVDYNIVIKSDNSISENININGQTFSNNEEFSEIKQEIINQLSDNLNKYNYEYTINKNNNQVLVEINKESNFKELLNNSLYNEVFEDYELFVNKGIQSFRNAGSNYLAELFVVKNYEEDLKVSKKIDTLNINIKFENIVTSTNADKYDEKTNTYTWVFKEEDINKTIKFSYDTSQKFKENNMFEFKNIIIIIVIVLIVLIILISSFIFMYQKKDRI